MHYVPLALLILASSFHLGRAQQLPPEQRGTVDTVVQVGVGWYQPAGGERRNDPNSVARALELAAPGCTVVLDPGDYPAFSIGFTNRQNNSSMGTGGAPLRPVVVRGRNGARIVAGADHDTIKIAQQYPVAHIRFENLEIHAGQRSGVIFYTPPPDGSNLGFEFLDCTIDGGFDHAQQAGRDSKWGVIAHGLKDFVFAGRSKRASVHSIRFEHAFYLQNPRGDITLENIDAARLGRTFVQVVAREKEGPPGQGRITVKGCKVEDTGLAQRDNFKGGTAFTFAGRLADCTILVEDCSYRAGFEPELHKLTVNGMPYNTSALVAWDGRESQPNGALILRNNHFEMAPGTGDRALVSIASCRSVSIEGNNRFLAGAHPVALTIDPLDASGKPGGLPNGTVHVALSTELRGALHVGGRTADEALRQELARNSAGR